jgi:hypothetical protein
MSGFFEEIPESDLPTSRRGRKPNPDTIRVRDALLNVKKGTALRATGMALDLNGKDAETVKRMKAAVSAQIRAGAALANLKVSVIFDGAVPTVKIVGSLGNN